MANRPNRMLEYAYLNHLLADRRERERREYYEHREAVRNGEVPEEPAGDSVYTASELGLLRKAADTSLNREDRNRAAYAATAIDPEQNNLEPAWDDLKEHLEVLRYSISVYFRSPVLALLSVLMLAGHTIMLVFILGVSAQASEEGGAAFGGPAVDRVLAGWTIYNCVALTVVAFSPLLLTSLPRGVWRLVGGRSHAIIQILILTAAVPAILSGVLFSTTGSGVSPMVPAVFAAHAVVPLVIRKWASRRLRSEIRRLRPGIERIAGALDAADNASYVGSLLKRKVIGTPGASLSGSDFTADQVASGVAGERKTAAILDDFARAKTNAIVFHSVRWNMDGAPYDIDHVVVIGQRVFFIDSKNWSQGNYTMMQSGDTVLRDGAPIPNGTIHVQAGADSYINAFGVTNSITQIVVWTDGHVANRNTSGPRLVTGSEMLDWLNQSSDDETNGSGYNVPLLRCLERNARG